MGTIIYKFPTIKEVEEADHLQICKWYRFLTFANDEKENKIMFAVLSKFKKGGGMTAKISKQVGWE